MKRILIAAALVAAVSAPAAAQSTMVSPRPVQFGIMAGASVPTGDFGDYVKTGYHFGGLVNFHPSMVPVALRGEVQYNSFTGKDFSFEGVDVSAEDGRILHGALNALYEFGAMGTTSTSHPYIIGGLGVYNSKGGSSSESSTDFGFNAGVGVRFGLGGLNTFAEARFHNVFVGDDEDGNGGSARFVPISFGIAF